jgi:replicative DNA helicase
MKGRKIESIESEKAVIGGLLLDSSQFLKVHEKIAPEDFSREIFGTIFYTMSILHDKRKTFDIAMIVDEMGENKSCELKNSLESLLLNLANECPSVANICAHADIIREKSVQRQLLQVATEIAHEAKKPGNKAIAKILDDAESKVKDLYSPAFCTEQVRLASLFRELAEEIDSSNPHEFCESYLQFTLIEVNKALVDTIRHIEDTHEEG